jgi:hypothetical protein
MKFDEDYRIARLRVSVLSEVYRKDFLPADFEDFKSDVLLKIIRYNKPDFENELHLNNWLNLYVPWYIKNTYRDYISKKLRRRDNLKGFYVSDKTLGIVGKNPRKEEMLIELDKVIKLYIEKYPKNSKRDLSIISEISIDNTKTIEEIAKQNNISRRHVYYIIAKFKNVKSEIETGELKL